MLLHMTTIDSRPGGAQLLPIDELRAHFPGLMSDVASLDGAGGTQVPRAVIDAVAAALRDAMSNLGGAFPASAVSAGAVAGARSAIADLVGGVADGGILGPNMTTLTFHLADALSRTWAPGDEIVVTSLDHDANIRPWALAANRVGATVRFAEFDVETGELPTTAFEAVISKRTRLVATTAASNAIGTRPDVSTISQAAHAVGALVYVDGVHATPHVPIDISALGSDFYTCSSYKFCGPHTGAVIADPELLERVQPSKLAPSTDQIPARFERGTPPLELLAGVTAAIDWLAGLTDAPGGRRARLLACLSAVETRLQTLLEHLVSGLSAVDGVRLLGDPACRTSTVSFVVAGHTPESVAARLASDGIAVWDGDNYAYELMRRFGLQDYGGAIRASIVLYNTAEEIDRLINAVARISVLP
jgi:cysteine desulfurase family protein (TIGR01976 family)